MARNSLMGSTSSFAHLLGLGAAAGKGRAAGEDDPDEKEHREDASAEDDDKGDDEDDKKDKSKARGKAKKARASDDDKKDGDDKKDDDEKAKADESDDDEDDEDDEEMKAARSRERARCAAIFSAPSAGARPDLAAHFAFRTSLSRADAIAALDVAASGQPAGRKPGGASLRERMDRAPNPPIGSGIEAQPLKPHQRLMAAHEMISGGKKSR